MISRERDLQISDFLEQILCVWLVCGNKIHPGDGIPNAARHKTRKKGASGKCAQNDMKKTHVQPCVDRKQYRNDTKRKLSSPSLIDAIISGTPIAVPHSRHLRR